MENKYNLWIGCKKTLKNVLIVWGIPAVLVLINNAVDWIPNEYMKIATPILAFISYGIKNWINNK